MQKGIIGKKLGMTQLFDEKGNVVPVTVIEAGPCVVSQKKTAENDGYEAVQIGFSLFVMPEQLIEHEEDLQGAELQRQIAHRQELDRPGHAGEKAGLHGVGEELGISESAETIRQAIRTYFGGH